MKIDLTTLKPIVDTTPVPAETAEPIAPPEGAPADFSKPYFSRLILEYSTNKEAQQKEYDALAEEARAKFGDDQPTYEKITTEKAAWWERTQAYTQARREHKAARDLVDAKYERHWRQM
jgi:hypothetical protein